MSAAGSGPARISRTSIWSAATMALAGVLAALLIAELITRAISEVDASGQVSVMGWQLRPYQLQVEHSAELIDDYLASDSSYQMYDPYLGWTIRPNGRGDRGLYRANSQGIRSDREYAIPPEEGVLRIALFGDSFTHGSQVEIEETWGYLLEQHLNEADVEAEVLNFGVGGYGMDQAFLRWQYEGRVFEPNIVLFGFYGEDVLRNVNLVRSISNPKSENPFSKPRFVLEEGNLTLINSPTIPPEQLVEELENIATSPLAEYEYYLADEYQATWWTNSRLAALMVAVAGGPTGHASSAHDLDRYALDGDFAPLALAIIDAFAADVADSGATFMIVELPGETELISHFRGYLAYEPLIQAVAENHSVIRTVDGFDPERIDIYYVGHYSAEGNRVIAQEVAEALLAWVEANR